MKGALYGIGVGIGDPEDMTLKAVRLIRESDVLILPHEDKSKCRAYQIARRMVPDIDGIETITLECEMVKDMNVRRENHRKIYEIVKNETEKGKKVAILTIGDPALYSTYSYVAELARKDGIESYAISAVSSVTACANRLGITLCDDKERMFVIPDVKELAEVLDLPGTKVIMKCGKAVKMIKDILKHRPVSVYAVADCGTDTEKLYRSLEELPEDENYMLTVIVKDNSDKWDQGGSNP